MIKALLIDDERPALRELEYFLKPYAAINIVGMYTNPLEALQNVVRLDPQVVFLDIQMPQLKGIDIASNILDRCPQADIIFITAFEQYALEAFELHALDYVLKPISKERFDITMKRIIKKAGHILESAEKKSLKIQMLGKFQIGWGEEEPVKWRSEKTKELFAFLLQNTGREVSKDEILEAVWQDTDIDKAIHQLHNGIYYIRKTLEEYGIDRSIINISGNYALRLGNITVDYLHFRECAKTVKNTITIEFLEIMIEIYNGEYLQGNEWMWAYTEREMLSRQYNEAMITLSKAYIEKNELKRAEELLLKAFGNNPFECSITDLLLKLYEMKNDRVKAKRHFIEYSKVLKEELGIKPENSIVNRYASIL